MPKAKKDTRLNKRFRSEDVTRWQLKADEETNGNLTLWIENTLNAKSKNEIVVDLSEQKQISIDFRYKNIHIEHKYLLCMADINLIPKLSLTNLKIFIRDSSKNYKFDPSQVKAEIQEFEQNS